MKKVLLVLLMVAGACSVVDDTPRLPELDDGFIKATVNGEEFVSIGSYCFLSNVGDVEVLNLFGTEDSLIYPFQSYLSFTLAYDTIKTAYNIMEKIPHTGASFREIDFDVTIARYEPIVFEGDSGFVELFHDRNEKNEWIIRGTFSGTFLIDRNPRADHLRSYSDTVEVRNGTFERIVRDKRGEED
ncbi:MAG: hypothetical protein ROO71_09380 [Balneola sp.]